MADKKADSNEFPLLEAQGLYASKIHGDGNCLFNALSDQLYGHQRSHSKLRASAVDEMRRNGSFYKQFLAVNPGGGTRRNEPRRKRKNAGAVSFTKAPSPEDIDDAFARRLQNMAQGGTYADNMEIQAFADAYQKNVKVYRSDGTYTISPTEAKASERATVHIAYHNWEHYSSIRNLAGPHVGLPELKIKEQSEEELAAQKVIVAQPKLITPTMITEVSSLIPQFDRDTIQKALEDLRGDVHAAVNKLLDGEDSSSSSSRCSSSATSFTERDPDSEDEEPRGPSKRRYRRSVEKSEPAKQYVPSNLSTSVTVEPSETVDASSNQDVLLPVRSQKPQRLRLTVKKSPLKNVDEHVSDSDDDFVPETIEDDDENDAASEYSSGTSRSASSARPSPARSRSTSKSTITRVQRQIKAQPKRTRKLRPYGSVKTPTDNKGFAAQSTPTTLGGGSIKAKAIKT